MGDTLRIGRGGRKRGARDVAIAVSLLAHLLVFALLARNAPTLIFRQPPVEATNVWLIPHLAPQAREARTRQRAPSSSTSAAVHNASTIAKPTTATTAAPSPVQAAPQAAPSSAESGPLASPGGVGAGLQGALRTGIGCDIGHAAHLTPEEKDRCNRRLGEEAKRGPKFIDTIPPEKRAYYDAVQQAYQAAADPIHPFIRDANGNVQPWGKGLGVGCGMKFGGPPPPPDHRSVTDKIKATGLLGLDLGPLRCGIVIPQGSMTPEVGIPVP
jgi:hypothetical protein